jgi:hypothetical protein
MQVSVCRHLCNVRHKPVVTRTRRTGRFVVARRWFARRTIGRRGFLLLPLVFFVLFRVLVVLMVRRHTGSCRRSTRRYRRCRSRSRCLLGFLLLLLFSRLSFFRHLRKSQQSQVKFPL